MVRTQTSLLYLFKTVVLSFINKLLLKDKKYEILRFAQNDNHLESFREKE